MKILKRYQDFLNIILDSEMWGESVSPPKARAMWVASYPNPVIK